ncbi:MAG: EamA family transporter [Alphaproteobacteria bacterium]|nr:EamA family transporter [Alphaproteobacteria bacterium]
MADSASPSAVPPLRGPHYALGVAMVAGAGTCFSFTGLAIRHLEVTDGWQILFYRSLASSAVVGLFLLVRNRGRVVESFRRIGPLGLVYALFVAIQFSFFVFAIINTTVANTVFIMSASPLFAALLGWALLRERVSPVTWVAIAAVLAGVALMIGGGIGGGTWFGDLIALGLPAAYAAMFLILRRAGDTDLMPAAFLGGLLTAVFAAFMTQDFAVSGHDLVLLVLMGGLMVSGALILLTLGGRYVPVAEVALLVMTETVLSPLWVWLFLGETPHITSLIGGAIVLSAVFGQAVIGLRAASRPPR